MDLFTKAKASISNAGKEFTQKANDVSGIARVSMRIKEAEKNLSDNIQLLGEQFYTQHQAEATKMFPELMYSIDNLQKQIERDKKELAVLKGLRICPNCGAEQDRTLVCCSVCGINMEEAERIMAPPKETVAFCTNCGKSLTPGAKFCMNCGNKIE